MTYFNFQLTIALVAGFLGALIVSPATRFAQIQWSAVHEDRIVVNRRLTIALLQGTLALQWLAVLIPFPLLWELVLPSSVPEPWWASPGPRCASRGRTRALTYVACGLWMVAVGRPYVPRLYRVAVWTYLAIAAARCVGFRPLVQAHLDGVPQAIRSLASQSGRMSRTEYKLKVRPMVPDNDILSVPARVEDHDRGPRPW